MRYDELTISMKNIRLTIIYAFAAIMTLWWLFNIASGAQEETTNYLWQNWAFA